MIETFMQIGSGVAALGLGYLIGVVTGNSNKDNDSNDNCHNWEPKSWKGFDTKTQPVKTVPHANTMANGVLIKRKQREKCGNKDCHKSRIVYNDWAVLNSNGEVIGVDEISTRC